MRALYFFLLLSSLFANNQDIKEVLSEYKRPFSVLALGCGELGLEIAQEFPLAIVTIAERDIGLTERKATHIFKYLERENIQNVLLLHKMLTFSDLITLSHVEHFDLVIAPDLLTKVHIPRSSSREDLLDIALKLTDHLFLVSEGTPLHYHSSQTTFLQENWFSNTPLPPLVQENGRSIYLESLLTPPFYRARTHIPGLSLITFLALRGSWPTKTSISEKLSSFSAEELSPFNLVLIGSTLYPRPSFFEKRAEGLESTLNFLNCTTKQELKEYLYLEK